MSRSDASADPKDAPSLPTRPERAAPEDPHEVENPGDPGPTVLVPPAGDDPRQDPRIPAPGRENVPPQGA